MTNDSWQYQGRQQHMWFGHGTKPQDAKPEAGAGSLDQRIAAAGHALVAGLPAARRNHPGARLGPHDHARLARVLQQVAQAKTASPRRIASDLLGRHPDAPGLASFIESGRLLKAASTQADLREATGKLAQSAQEMGLDQFKPFLRRADEHLAAQQAQAPKIKDAPQPTPPRYEARPNPAQAAEPDHSAFWWWLHGLGLASTRHEKADILRRGMGAASGSIYYRDGVPLDVERMSDDEVLDLERQTRGQRPMPLPVAIAAPIMTSWGWDNTQPYNQAKREILSPGTHETINGRVPTREEAIRLIEEQGGIVDRIEEGHPPGGVSTHHEPHINYYYHDGVTDQRATVIIKPWR